MEVFARQLPDQLRERQLRKAFTPILTELSVNTYSCRILRNNCATVTIADVTKAQKLLDLYGERSFGAPPPPKALIIHGKRVKLTKSKNAPDELELRSLRQEELEKSSKVPRIPISEPKKTQKKFTISALTCGLWDYSGSEPVFVRYFQDPRPGVLSLRRSSINISLLSLDDLISHDIVFDYHSLGTSIYLGNSGNPTVTLSLEAAPRLYEENLYKSFTTLGLVKKDNRTKKERVETLGGSFGAVGAVCLTYQLTLTAYTDIWMLQNLKKERHIPALIPWPTRTIEPLLPLRDQMVSFMYFLSQEDISYRIRYQLQMLVWNGILAPNKVAGLFPEMPHLLRRVGIDQAAKALKNLAREVQYPGPEAEAYNFSVPALKNTLTELEKKSGYEIYIRKSQASNRNRALIHKATVTPLGIYLYGPDWEPTNRVLRRYSAHTEYFLRVEFMDETGDPITYDRAGSLDRIYGQRYKGVMQSGIMIGGRSFEFLGFSHSSLRSQSCWFVAAFTTESGEYIDARTIIRGLGDFSKIRCPARCAARIGQAFSDTFTSIEISEAIVEYIPDVERSGRVFSDGCGTCSRQVMHKIWREYASNAKLKPTVFQIRCAGAKGMISLDSRLKGDVLRLREPSMVKFKTSNAWNIELCGSGMRALPMFLNRQLIKILEDLDVAPAYLLEMQKEEIDSLRAVSRSPILAANFLERANLSQSTRTPFLIRTMVRLGVPFLNDDFLRRMIELAVLVKLRELKYKARIRVHQGVTLFGIMDETKTLNEGEIYCPYVNSNGQREVLIGNNIIVTRSPALHPGDIQLVNAVDVPKDSPLCELHNCIAFSQRGERDLPSKLSGGDLDGDLYNIIWDQRLTLNKNRRPLQTALPADYPRVPEMQLDRLVTREDIVNHFLTFMQQDQLGYIATAHQIVADQQPLGTFDRGCLTLAHLHSTAVDFSKTGIPADLTQIPKYSRTRPDFMAPGPRVVIEDKIELNRAIAANPDDDDDEEDSRPATRYYRSEKVLGQLYRMIDEDTFLDDIRASAKEKNSNAPDPYRSLWAYVSRETTGRSWAHYVEVAEDIKELYEDNLKDLMYKYSQTPWTASLDELEVFIGTIIGKNHNLSSRQREASTEMREEYNALVEYTTSQIRNEDDDKKDALERSIACFFIGLDEDEGGVSLGKSGKIRLRSFRWIAAAICLQEVERFQKSK